MISVVIFGGIAGALLGWLIGQALVAVRHGHRDGDRPLLILGVIGATLGIVALTCLSWLVGHAS